MPKFFWQVIDGELIWGPLMTGLVTTIELSIYSMILTIAIGLLTALLRMSDSVSGQILGKIYLEAVRKHAAAGANAGVLLRHFTDHWSRSFLDRRAVPEFLRGVIRLGDYPRRH